ncbi:MAG: hypothetical protein WCB68_02360, partial [Pyrinomonadaceae bacterium]
MSTSQKNFAPRFRFMCAMLLSFLLIFAYSGVAQKIKKSDATTQTAAPPALTRTTTRHETRRLGYGSTLTIIGAPVGSVTIEGWQRSEVDITADIELRADTEEDLTRLAALNSFVIDEDFNHLRVLTTGTHDKTFMRRNAKDFPKKLLGLPWKIDYRIRVPEAIDLEINVGRGAFNIKGVEGALNLKAQESDATLALTGGIVVATVGSGSVNLRIASRSWRGSGADIRLATGSFNIELPAGYSGDIDAEVLRTGRIENSYDALTPRERTTPSERALKARAGAGGSTLALTVTDGTIKIK